MAIRPVKVRLRTYQIGFGDCFLLSVEYSDGKEKHVLIDFGTMRVARSVGIGQAAWLRLIAENIKERCGGKLDIVIATHRHKDHILGFATDGDADGAGTLIRDCKPKLVIQPWTEDPSLPVDATDQLALVGPADAKRAANRNFATTLLNIQSVSASVVDEVRNLADASNFSRPIDPALMEAIEIIGLDNVSNQSSVENLATMGEQKALYLRYGDGPKLTKRLKTLLPAVKLHVLGPPTIDQYQNVQKQDDKHPEFWSLQAMSRNYWSVQAATSTLAPKQLSRRSTLFPKAKRLNNIPPHDRWFVRQLREIRADQLLKITQAMDSALNNTSLILVFEIGKMKFLFPGDAQIENWEHVWSDENADKGANLKLLADVDLYKVGHHGSTNATPRTMFNNFAKTKKAASEGKTPRPLTSVVSTMGNENNPNRWVHGSPGNKSEVPRGPLIDALKQISDLKNTRDVIPTKDLFMKDLVFDV